MVESFIVWYGRGITTLNLVDASGTKRFAIGEECLTHFTVTPSIAPSAVYTDTHSLEHKSSTHQSPGCDAFPSVGSTNAAV